MPSARIQIRFVLSGFVIKARLDWYARTILAGSGLAWKTPCWWLALMVSRTLRWIFNWIDSQRLSLKLSNVKLCNLDHPNINKRFFIGCWVSKQLNLNFSRRRHIIAKSIFKVFCWQTKTNDWLNAKRWQRKPAFDATTLGDIMTSWWLKQRLCWKIFDSNFNILSSTIIYNFLKYSIFTTTLKIYHETTKPCSCACWFPIHVMFPKTKAVLVASVSQIVQWKKLQSRSLF